MSSKFDECIKYFKEELDITEYQRRIILLYQEGKTIREIADILQISPHCVKAILNLVLRKQKDES